MENWKDLYTEIATLLNNAISEVKWIDLWHNQVNFLEEEHPFPAPAIFINLRAVSTDDRGQNIQNLNVQVECFLFYETFADTFVGAYNQASALDFLDVLSKINKTLHGISGANFSNMRKTDIAPVDTGSAQNLYRIAFTCIVNDETAQTNNEHPNSGWGDYVMD